MDNEEYINKITLEFLLNPILQEKLCKGTHNNINLTRRMLFHSSIDWLLSTTE